MLVGKVSSPVEFPHCIKGGVVDEIYNKGCTNTRIRWLVIT